MRFSTNHLLAVPALLLLVVAAGCTTTDARGSATPSATLVPGDDLVGLLDFDLEMRGPSEVSNAYLFDFLLTNTSDEMWYSFSGADVMIRLVNEQGTVVREYPHSTFNPALMQFRYPTLGPGEQLVYHGYWSPTEAPTNVCPPPRPHYECWDEPLPAGEYVLIGTFHADLTQAFSDGETHQLHTNQALKSPPRPLRLAQSADGTLVASSPAARPADEITLSPTPVIITPKAPLAELVKVSLDAPDQVARGELVPLVLTVRNVSGIPIKIESGLDIFDIVVTTPKSEIVWRPWDAILLIGYTQTLHPGEIKQFRVEWDQTDSTEGNPVRPGRYQAVGRFHGSVRGARRNETVEAGPRTVTIEGRFPWPW